MAVTSDRAFTLIESAFQRQRLAHAFLITGLTGSGKEELASRVIGMVNGGAEDASGLDLFGEAPEPTQRDLDEWQGEFVRIVRPQSKSRMIRVDDMRSLEKNFQAVAPKGKWKIGVVVDADRMNDAAANAFLKTLEEPPSDSLLLMLTSKPERLLPTILSRCVKINLLGSHGKGSEHVEWMDSMSERLNSLFRDGFAEVSKALMARALFSAVLAERKADITKKNTAMLKEETAMYKQTTDGVWLKTREDFYKALTEAEYLEERAQLLEVLIYWMGERLKAANLAERHDEVSSLIKRLSALEDMRATLETNASENLALDVGFVAAFAA